MDSQKVVLGEPAAFQNVSVLKIAFSPHCLFKTNCYAFLHAMIVFENLKSLFQTERIMVSEEGKMEKRRKLLFINDCLSNQRSRKGRK